MAQKIMVIDHEQKVADMAKRSIEQDRYFVETFLSGNSL